MPVDFLSHRTRTGIYTSIYFLTIPTLFSAMIKIPLLNLVKKLTANFVLNFILFIVSFPGNLESVSSGFVIITMMVFWHGIKLILFFALSLILRGVLRMLLLLSGDIHINPGPRPNKFKFAVWNVDSLLTRDKCKLNYINAIDAIHKFDIFGVCETYLGPNTEIEHLEIPGFNHLPLRADCSDHEGRPKGGVCLYYKDHLPIKRREDLCSLEETIVVEVRLKNNKKVFLILTYRSPSKSSNQEIDNFCTNLSLMIDKMKEENPLSIILTGDFNGRSPHFWTEEIVENSAGKSLVEFSIENGLSQLISEPTHFPQENISTCIDHIYTSCPDGFVDWGVIHSPDPKCKHSIIHGTLNFSIPPPPPHKRRAWKYDNANIEEVKKMLNSINWYQEFNSRSVDDSVKFFTDNLLEIMNNNIPNEVITVFENDAPWMTNELKKIIKRKQRIFQRWKKNRSMKTKENLNKLQETLKVKIDEAKCKYNEKLVNKLNDPKSSHKTFWSAYKKFLNKRKTTNIPPIEVDNSYLTCFKKKAEAFNKYFSEQCSPINNINYLPYLPFKTRNKLLKFNVHMDQILDIVNSLNATKASGPDEISVRMLQLCPNDISMVLKILYEKILHADYFPNAWKMANVQPVHKKNSRQLLKNYRPISLLPICSKIFEKIIFDQTYSFLMQNNLISENQSGFKPGDSTICQLISITNEIYESFEDYCETRALFLDLSKAFDKVWHIGLKKKLITNGIDGKAFKIFDSFLQNRVQRVVLNGVSSDWQHIKAGVPQGSVLGPLLFLIYINDLTENISSNIKLFADDVALFIKVVDPTLSCYTLQGDLEKITKWANTWKMQFNPDPTKPATEVIFSHKINKPFHPTLTLNNIPVKTENCTVHLGVTLDSKLNFSDHIAEQIKTANKGVSLLKFLSTFTNRNTLNMLYKMHVRSHLDYGDVIFHDQLSSSTNILEKLQYKAALIVSGCWKGTNKLKLYTELGWESLFNRRHCRRLCFYYKILNKLSPPYLKYNQNFQRTLISKRYEKSFFPYCVKHWNSLPKHIKNSNSYAEFKRKIFHVYRPLGSVVFKSLDIIGLKLLTRLRCDFSDLREHRFRHKFNCISPLCKCGCGEESTAHFLLKCPLYNRSRYYLLKNVINITNSFSIIQLSDEDLLNLLLYGSPNYSVIWNYNILSETIIYIKSTKRFDFIEAYRNA